MSPWGSDCTFTAEQGVSPLRVRWAWRAVSEDPSYRGFLLIVRTGQIVTAYARPVRNGTTKTSTAGYSGVPAYSQVLQRPELKLHRYSSRYPHIAMRRGPYLHPPGFTDGALRMASEDSQSLNTCENVLPRIATLSASVHRSPQCEGFDNAGWRQVSTESGRAR